MVKNNFVGILVTFDGPNGAGKSTIIKRLQERLVQKNIKVFSTKEPTKSVIGEFTRKQSEKVSGNVLACLVAADRYKHVEDEIIPALKEGQVVLCDRYILSSFILQGMDKVDFDFISELNSNIIEPDIQIVLYASEKVIQQRLKERDKLTRFERNNRTSEELDFLSRGVDYMNNKYSIDSYKFNTEEEIEKNLDNMVKIIEEC